MNEPEQRHDRHDHQKTCRDRVQRYGAGDLVVVAMTAYLKPTGRSWRRNCSRMSNAATVIAAGSGDERTEQRHDRHDHQKTCRDRVQRYGAGDLVVVAMTAYLKPTGRSWRRNCSRMSNAATVIAAGSVMNEPSSGMIDMTTRKRAVTGCSGTARAILSWSR